METRSHAWAELLRDGFSTSTSHSSVPTDCIRGVYVNCIQFTYVSYEPAYRSHWKCILAMHTGYIRFACVYEHVYTLHTKRIRDMHTVYIRLVSKYEPAYSLHTNCILINAYRLHTSCPCIRVCIHIAYEVYAFHIGSALHTVYMHIRETHMM